MCDILTAYNYITTLIGRIKQVCFHDLHENMMKWEMTIPTNINGN